MDEQLLGQARVAAAQARELREAAEEASTRYQHLLRLLAERGASHAEIARGVGIAESAVRRIVARDAVPPVERLRCSSCGRDQGEVGKLIAGPGVWICDICVDQALEGAAPFESVDDASARCAFCGTARHDVGALFEHRGLRVCDQCIDLCVEIISES